MEDSLFDTHAEMEDRHWWFVARRRIIDDIVSYLMRGQDDGLIVDVGCGTGGTSGHLSERYRCLGLDASSAAVAIATRKYPKARFTSGDMKDILSQPESKSRLYLLMDVLEHVEDDRGFLSDLIFFMMPGAHLLITVPADMALWSQHDVTAHHLRRYDRAGLERVIKGLPVRVRALSYFNSRLFLPIYLIRQVNRLLGRSFGRGGSDFDLPAPWLNRLLARIFAGESRRLLALLKHGSGPGYGRGASLLVVLEKT